MLAIVETPAGQRQLRYRVSPADLGVDAINQSPRKCNPISSKLSA